MQNILDVNYKGSFDGYVKDNDGSEEDASAMYSDSIDYLAIFFTYMAASLPNSR